MPVKIGKAEIGVDPEKIKSIRFYKSDSLFLAKIFTKDGEVIEGVVNGSLSISGDAPLGRYSIKVGNVAEIVFKND